MAIVSGNKGKKPGERLMQITVRGEKKNHFQTSIVLPTPRLVLKKT